MESVSVEFLPRSYHDKDVQITGTSAIYLTSIGDGIVIFAFSLGVCKSKV